MNLRLFNHSIWTQNFSFLMSPFSSSTAATSAAASKRKLDDILDDPLSPRMRKDQNTLPFYNSQSSSSSVEVQCKDETLASSSAFSETKTRAQNRLVQFFVRIFSDRTLVLVADKNDVVYAVHERIFALTGIPIIEQRLIYNGKQLQWDQTLGECRLSDDASLQLVGRMRSTGHPQAWQLLGELVALVFDFCRNGPNSKNSSFVTSYGVLSESNCTVIKALISKFLSMITQHSDTEQSIGHLKIFLASSAPLALVVLYRSLNCSNRVIAAEAIRYFVLNCRTLPRATYRHCVHIVLEFCKLLARGAGTNDPLYVYCRNSLGSMVAESNVGSCGVEDLIDVQEYFQFIRELGDKLSHGLVLSMGPDIFSGVRSDDVRDFTAFLNAVRNQIIPKLGARLLLPKGNDGGCNNAIPHGEQKFLHGLFTNLLGKMDSCLEKMEGSLAMIAKEIPVQRASKWDQYFAILKELHSIARMFEGAEELFFGILRPRKVSFCYLIIKYAKRTDDHNWILVHKEVTNFEARRHLVMMMFPDLKDEYDELHEMLIDRSQLLAESFAYIGHAEPESLHGGIFMEFKNEEATGPGVLREWFFLVCQAIFNPQNALFVACPNDRRRFFPNPASKVDPLHLEYFSFCGRVIALALMHKIQVGIVFDRVFVVQLAGKNVSLEDIRDADPYLYNSCKAILEMDADIVDQDALGLTFVREVYELGTRKVVELCADGKNISVTSKNRKEYVYLLIQHSFVTSIAEQVAHFTMGFADIMNGVDIKTRAMLQKSFFESIELEDFDWMLHGSESAICVEGWMAHTKYTGFKETDPQIRWFWKIVGEMSANQKKILLFFWTSIKFLPMEGFRGLASPLHIYLNHEPSDHLPSSHTCFYRLCFPAYPSMKIMQERLHLITQEHVGCSFGTW